MKTQRAFAATLAISTILLASGMARADEPSTPASDRPIVLRQGPVAEQAEAPAEPMKLVRRSPGLFGGGIAAVTVGGLGMLVGAAMAVSEDTIYDSCMTSSETIVMTGGYPLDCGEKNYVPGIATLLVGTVVLAAGIPMIVVGNQRIAVSERVSVGVAPRADGGSAKIVVTF